MGSLLGQLIFGPLLFAVVAVSLTYSFIVTFFVQYIAKWLLSFKPRYWMTFFSVLFSSIISIVIHCIYVFSLDGMVLKSFIFKAVLYVFALLVTHTIFLLLFIKQPDKRMIGFKNGIKLATINVIILVLVVMLIVSYSI
ncbi:MAG: hypothetical protein COA63_003630 [Methylophaga sp.]|nr:hypothetical protein [Methylophaga sp.]